MSLGSEAKAAAIPAQDVRELVGDLRPYAARRVERGERVLRDEGAGGGNGAAPLGGGKGQEVGAAQENLAARDLDRAGEDAEDRFADHRLARA
jgi:hypothetical protein